jgi:Dual specificity phosphatase, catalytic domain
LQGSSVLIHSVRGQSRACCATVGHLMHKYQWSLFKALEFLNSRRPGAEIRGDFFEQLEKLEVFLERIQKQSTHWNEPMHTDDQGKKLEEAVLRNTFVNSRLEGEKLFLEPGKAFDELKQEKIKWLDKQDKEKNVREFIEDPEYPRKINLGKKGKGSCMKKRSSLDSILTRIEKIKEGTPKWNLAQGKSEMTPETKNVKKGLSFRSIMMGEPFEIQMASCPGSRSKLESPEKGDCSDGKNTSEFILLESTHFLT